MDPSALLSFNLIPVQISNGSMLRKQQQKTLKEKAVSHLLIIFIKRH